MFYPIFVLKQGLTDTNAFTISDVGDVVAAGNVTASKFTGTIVGNVTGNVTGNLTGNVSGSTVATNSIVCNNAITATLGYVKTGDKFIVGTTNGVTTDVNANATTNCRFVITGGIITAATQY